MFNIDFSTSIPSTTTTTTQEQPSTEYLGEKVIRLYISFIVTLCIRFTIVAEFQEFRILREVCDTLNIRKA